ncbi:class I SAM-dependent methyltransferase [Intrasporangium calvum]|uniref:class I SAM-dependent methyltransferase n=1 Tax=Intrasporangium calvum TaxID=53358 RepID=UPI000DF5F131|nr:class I SAM-dependent methyltransferase [Intrasporangium calvum]AXG12549.1 class I SAM-dependent methyltransferase [Intrasporangium calvum]
MTDEQQGFGKFAQDLFGWYSITMLALGARTGLLEALLSGGGTVDEISQQAGTDLRNTLEWLRALTAAGHVEVEGDRFHVTEQTRAVMGPGFPSDVRGVLAFVDGMSEVMDDVAAAVVSGRGVEPGVYDHAFGPAVGRINTPTYSAALVDEWIAGVDGVGDALREGGAIADIACGNGDAVGLAARAFPRAHVVGFDVVVAQGEQQAELPGNAELRVADAEQLPRDRTYDLVMCLDAFHHLGDPVKVAFEVHAVLRPGGAFMVVEPTMTGDLAVDAREPFSVVIYASMLLWCLQENLAAGGAGHGADGPDWVVDALSRGGFGTVTVRPSETGYNVITGIA